MVEGSGLRVYGFEKVINRAVAALPQHSRHVGRGSDSSQ